MNIASTDWVIGDACIGKTGLVEKPNGGDKRTSFTETRSINVKITFVDNNQVQYLGPNEMILLITEALISPLVDDIITRFKHTPDRIITCQDNINTANQSPPSEQIQHFKYSSKTCEGMRAIIDTITSRIVARALLAQPVSVVTNNAAAPCNITIAGINIGLGDMRPVSIKLATADGSQYTIQF